MLRGKLLFLPCILSMLAILPVLKAGDVSAGVGDDVFREKFDFLHTQNVSKVGREVVVDAFEEFIREYADDPRVAEAMLELGHRYLLDIPAQGIHREPELALRWFRKAARRATPGSGIWLRAQFTLAGRLLPSSPAEAREILEDVAARAEGDSLTLAKVEYQLQRLCTKQRDFDVAETHCRRLLGWYSDRSRVPKAGLAKADVDGVILGAGSAMVFALVEASEEYSKTERAKRIRTLMNDYPSVALLRDGEKALQDLDSRTELPNPEDYPAPEATNAWLRWGLAGCSLLVITVFGYWLCRRGRV